MFHLQAQKKKEKLHVESVECLTNRKTVAKQRGNLLDALWRYVLQTVSKDY